MNTNQDQDELSTVPCKGGLTTVEEYMHWARMREQDTARFHLETYGEPVVSGSATTIPCAR